MNPYRFRSWNRLALSQACGDITFKVVEADTGAINLFDRVIAGGFP
jgi:hypothetical protein